MLCLPTDINCHPGVTINESDNECLQVTQPIAPVFRFTIEEPEKCGLNTFCYRAAATVADGHVVDLTHGCYLYRGAGEKGFISAVELFA